MRFGAGLGLPENWLNRTELHNGSFMLTQVT